MAAPGSDRQTPMKALDRPSCAKGDRKVDPQIETLPADTASHLMDCDVQEN